jgi:hypothetical protein
MSGFTDSVYDLDNDEIKISTTCLESFPCQHYVKVNYEPYTLTDARAIVKKFLDAGQPVPKHFHYLTKKRKKRKKRCDEVNA